jgi:hypothetical protein
MPLSPTLKMEELRFSETLITTHKTAVHIFTNMKTSDLISIIYTVSKLFC